jgi:hypothetical protein
MAYSLRAYDVFAPTDGSGNHRQPVLEEAARWGTEVETAAALAALGITVWSGTLSALPSAVNGTAAAVLDDGTPSNNGVYMREAGAWVKKGPLPAMPGPAGPQGDPGADADGAAIDAAVDAAIAAEITARDAAISAAVNADWRPGAGISAYSGSFTGGSSTPPSGAAETSARGKVRRLTGAGRVVSAQRYPVVHGQAWQADAAIRRITNPTDPAGDAVHVDIAWLDGDGAVIAPSTLVWPATSSTPFTASQGSVLLSFAFGFGTPFPPNAGAVDAVVRVITYGSDGVTDVEALGVVRAPWYAALAALQAAGGGSPILALTSSHTLAEFGQSITPTLNWTLDPGRTYVSQTINGGAISVSDRSWSPASPITADATYTLAVTDALGNVFTKAVTVDFRHRAFWGVSALTTLDAAGILALANSGLVTAPALSATLDCTGGRYVYFAYPQTLGAAPPMKIYGFDVVPVVTNGISVTTGAGFTGNYRLMRSSMLLTDSAVTVLIG